MAEKKKIDEEEYANLSAAELRDMADKFLAEADKAAAEGITEEPFTLIKIPPEMPAKKKSASKAEKARRKRLNLLFPKKRRKKSSPLCWKKAKSPVSSPTRSWKFWKS